MKDNDHSNRFKSVELLNHVKRHSLQVVCKNFNHKDPHFSFITKCTMLNYVMFKDCLSKQLVSYEILAEGSISSTSDRLPIVAKVCLNSNPHRVIYSDQKPPAWHKVNEQQINSYQESLEEPIHTLIEDGESDVDSMYETTLLQF